MVKRTITIVHTDSSKTIAQLGERHSPVGYIAYYQGDFYRVSQGITPTIHLADPVPHGRI